MDVLVVGGGGREHALAWKLAQSGSIRRVFVAPGNAGTAMERGVENLPIPSDDIDALASFAARQKIGLTVVGPEAPLVAGITDHFRARGLACFGPSAQAARLEGSKRFAKDFMARHNIPTAAYGAFTELTAARAFIEKAALPLVIKADGLAAGKGVVIVTTPEEAVRTTEEMLSGAAFGDAGKTVVIEEFLAGEEASFTVMVGGESILPLATSQDHKARDDGDQGPNTGGMGAYSPAPVVSDHVYQRVMREVIEPTVRGMALEGTPYTGFLYAGLMIGTDGNPKVLEYNCRFGDPETQPIVMRLQSDLADLCLACLENRLDGASIQWDQRAALGVVMAAGGYPISYRKGDPINGLDEKAPDDVKVFHSGTVFQNDAVITAGGRVLCVTALGRTVREAQAKAYAHIERIHWDGVYYRTDIGYRAVEREQAGGN
ncbi:phosphoribosylglycinamide synthetase phosphoribosylamine-glycine ligase [uncultured Desulfatiglans sp.]|nr:phosphoribosylglycinamide synthetase phosphoribosylamine-glycine ligase [uncultured Desulfatiglans sp.]